MWKYFVSNGSIYSSGWIFLNSTKHSTFNLTCKMYRSTQKSYTVHDILFITFSHSKLIFSCRSWLPGAAECWFWEITQNQTHEWTNQLQPLSGQQPMFVLGQPPGGLDTWRLQDTAGRWLLSCQLQVIIEVITFTEEKHENKWNKYNNKYMHAWVMWPTDTYIKSNAKCHHFLPPGLCCWFQLPPAEATDCDSEPDPDQSPLRRSGPVHKVTPHWTPRLQTSSLITNKSEDIFLCVLFFHPLCRHDISDSCNQTVLLLLLVVVLCLYIPGLLVCRRVDDTNKKNQRVHYLSNNSPSDLYFYAVTVHTGLCSAASMSAKVRR